MKTDPVLLKAVRRVMVDMKNAERMGAPYSPSDLEATMRSLTGNKFGADDYQRVMSTVNTDPSLANLGRSALQGFAFNFGDEAAGLLGGGEEGKEDFRLRDEAFARAHPWMNAGAGALGGLAWGGAAPAASATTVSQAARLAAGAGALYGAASGAGAGEGLRGRVAGAATGALGGAAIGGAMGGGVAKARALLSPLARAERKVTSAIEQSGGEKVVVPVLGAADDAGRGKDFMLGDATRRLQTELDVAANASPNVNAQLAEVLDARQRGQVGRAQADVTALLGKTPHAFERGEKLKTARDAIAEKLFGTMRKENPNLDPAAVDTRIGSYLRQPKVSSLWNEAQREIQIGELPQPTGITNFEGLQNFKGKLDDAVSAAFRAGKGNLATRLREVRDHVAGAVDDLVPGYADANREYARRIRLEEALEAGRQAWKNGGDFADSRTTRLIFSRLSDGEKREFRKGLASELANDLAGQKTNRDVASSFTNASDEMQSKLEMVFGNKKTFDEFMKRQEIERKMAAQRASVGNSKTALRQAGAGADALDVGAAGVTGGFAGAGVSAVGAGAKMAKGYRDQKTAERVAALLTTTGSDARDVLTKLKKGGSPKIGRMGVGVPVAFTSLLDDL